ncbi:BON domain-containing protein [Paenalcaligenes niemegkensis]|uniref:BON domain-containing protein n=1 Tax=Paenalcaligenes niemegkensis TaxID=2895469 RepID=UPI001EE8D36C|nr:BON domain-containing protein [Paenalcaligenes niemegkensis]MCQ9615574.1 BON domain-containing protein [Paenalcaligenes niemegkensis]
MSFTLFPHRHAVAALALAGLTALSGCAAVVVGGTAATTAVVATDRRTTGEQVEDKAIILKAGSETRQVLEGKQGRINVESYGGQVLLTGDVPTEQEKQQANDRVSRVEKVKSVVNRLRVGAPTELSVRSNDSWLSTKVMSTLVNTKDVPSRTISVTTERGVVYLQGRVTQDEGQRAAKAVAGIQGVNEVVKLFHYVSPESLIERREAAAVKEGSSTPSSSPEQSATTLDDGPQAIPVQ